MNEKKSFYVIGMSCAGCAANIQQALSERKGVIEARVNFAASDVIVEYNPALVSDKDLQKTVQEAGYDLLLENETEPEQAEILQREAYDKLRRKTIGALLLSLPVFVIGMFFMHMPYGNWIMLGFTLPVLLVFGRDFFINAWRQLKHGHANMDTLVAVSTGVAFLFSLFNTLWPTYWTDRGLEAHIYYEAAAVIIALILLGRLLESRAKSNTSTAIRKLIGLQPKEVIRILEDGTEQVIPIKAVQPGDILLVKPGDKIPVDGSVTEGVSFVDESMITGESIPVEKVKGQPVYAGTINEKGSFRFRADKVGGETVLANIIRMVQEAQGSKAPVQKLVDRIAGIFVPVVMGIAVITFIVWMLIGGDLAFTHALLTSITVLVIACPCALGLATPTAIMVGIGKGAEHNILIKDAESLELMYRVNAIVLDKTGTITKGNFVVQKANPAGNAMTANDLLAISASCELSSTHPIGNSIVEAAEEKGLSIERPSKVEEIAGHGIRAELSRGVVLCGNRKLMDAQNVDLSVYQKENFGTEVLVALNGKFVGNIVISDTVKDDAKDAIADVKKQGIITAMLTGDAQESADAVAKETGIDEVHAKLLPQDKLSELKKIRENHGAVMFVGDGINDAPVLAGADVGAAMGSGADAAIEAADVVFMNSEMKAIPEAVGIAKMTNSISWQNVVFALAIKIIVMIMGLFGFANMWIAVFADTGVSVLCLLNSIRILHRK